MNPSSQPRALPRRFWLLPLMIAAGVAIGLIIVKTHPAMEHQAMEPQGSAVTTLPLRQYPVRPRVTGYGEVRPDVRLDMRAEVAGRVAFVHPQLKKGAILPAGTLVVRIDDSDYRLALKKARASLAQQRANLAEQGLAQQDAELSLQLAKDKLTLAEAERVRFEKLLTKGTVAQSAVDAQRAAVLQVKQEVQTLQNQLDAMPYSTAVLAAQAEIAQSEVETQQLNVQRTEIRLPFDARIASLAVEADQFVGQNSSLFGAQTIDKVVIEAQVGLGSMRLLARGFDLGPTTLESLFDGSAANDSLINRLGLSAKVRLVGGAPQANWNATVERISSTLDPNSRTLGVIVSVSNPYQDIQPGLKPPLIDGMYMEVELTGRAQPFWVVPRDALHEGELYLVDAEQRLQRFAASGYPQQQMLLLDPATPLQTDTPLITSDLFPAVGGMLLAPRADADADALAALQAWLEAH